MNRRKFLVGTAAIAAATQLPNISNGKDKGHVVYSIVPTKFNTKRHKNFYVCFEYTDTKTTDLALLNHWDTLDNTLNDLKRNKKFFNNMKIEIYQSMDNKYSLLGYNESIQQKRHTIFTSKY